MSMPGEAGWVDTSSIKKLNDFGDKLKSDKLGKNVGKINQMFKGFAGGAGGGLISVLNTLSKFIDLAGILELALKPLEIPLKIISALFKGLVGEAIQPIIEAMQPFYDVLIGLMPIFGEIGGQIGELLATILTPLIQILALVVQAFMPLLADILTPIISVLNEVFGAFMPILVDILTPIITILSDVFGAFLPILDDILTPIIPLLGDIFGAFLPILNDILEPLEPLLKVVGDALSWFSDTALGWIVDGIGFVGDMILGVVNFIIDTINTIMNILTLGIWDDIPNIGESSGSPGGSGGKSGRKKKPPELQYGAIVTRPTHAIVGEAGAEAITPLDKFYQKQDEMIFELRLNTAAIRELKRTKQTYIVERAI